VICAGHLLLLVRHFAGRGTERNAYRIFGANCRGQLLPFRPKHRSREEGAVRRVRCEIILTLFIPCIVIG
jgi:hypothetical protein